MRGVREMARERFDVARSLQRQRRRVTAAVTGLYLLATWATDPRVRDPRGDHPQSGAQSRLDLPGPRPSCSGRPSCRRTRHPDPRHGRGVPTPGSSGTRSHDRKHGVIKPVVVSEPAVDRSTRPRRRRSSVAPGRHPRRAGTRHDRHADPGVAPIGERSRYLRRDVPDPERISVRHRPHGAVRSPGDGARHVGCPRSSQTSPDRAATRAGRWSDRPGARSAPRLVGDVALRKRGTIVRRHSPSFWWRRP